MTVKELIEYLQTLKPESTVQVAVASGSGYESWTAFSDIKIEDNTYYYDGDKPYLELGEDR